MAGPTMAGPNIYITKVVMRMLLSYSLLLPCWHQSLVFSVAPDLSHPVGMRVCDTDGASCTWASLGPAGRVPRPPLYPTHPSTPAARFSAVTDTWAARDGTKTVTDTVFRDARSGLQVNVRSGLFNTPSATAMGVPGAVEWKASLRNSGNASSPAVCGPYVCGTGDGAPSCGGNQGAPFAPAGPAIVDLVLRTPHGTNTTVHAQLGSDARPTDFMAQTSVLTAGESFLASVGSGRSSEGVLPVWGFDGGDDASRVVLVLGWTGNWRMNASRSADGTTLRVTVTAGTLCASLEPGEFVPLGSALAVPYTGNDARLGYVLLRRLLARDRTPRLLDGALPSYLSWDTYDRWSVPGGRNESGSPFSYDAVHTLAAAGGLDTYWVDASWFNNPGGLAVGNWKLPLSLSEDLTHFPSGIRALFDHWRRQSLNPAHHKTIMWVEPERVSPDTHGVPTYMRTVFPSYVFALDNANASTTLVNLGDEDARRYLRDFLSTAVEKYALDVMRIDFNTNPAIVWFEAADSKAGPDAPGKPFRRGIAEAKSVNQQQCMHAPCPFLFCFSFLFCGRWGSEQRRGLTQWSTPRCMCLQVHRRPV